MTRAPIPGTFEWFQRQYPYDRRRAYQEFRKSLGESYFDENDNFIDPRAESKERPKGALNWLLVPVGIVAFPVLVVLALVAIVLVIAVIGLVYFLVFAIPTVALWFAFGWLGADESARYWLVPIGTFALFAALLYWMFPHGELAEKIRGR
jgi:hypothetical protein